MKSRDGKSQRREEKKKEDQKRESLRRQKIQVREKVGKWRNTVFFQWFVAPEGQKVGSLKRRVRSQPSRWEMNNCTPLWREAHFEIKMSKPPHVRATSGLWSVVSHGRHKGLRTVLEVSKTWGFCSISENDGKRGALEEDLQRCIFRGSRNTRDMFIRAVKRSGRWFPERGCILEHQIFRFAGMILRDRCSTSCDLAALFSGRGNA